MEAMMSPDSSIPFNVVGAGYVAEHRDDNHQRHLSDLDQRTIGPAVAWLAFYAIAAVVVVVSNFQETARLVSN
jgi:hypothetical protein